MRLRRVWPLIGCLLLVPALAPAQQRELTLEDLYHPERRLDATGSPPRGLQWLDEGHVLWPRPARDGNTAALLRLDVASGETEPFHDAGRMRAAFEALEGVSAEAAARTSERTDYTFSDDFAAVVVEIDGDLYHYAFEAGRAARLTSAPGEEEQVSFSPDGRLVAFVRAHDLFVVDVATGRERALTSDGSPVLLNGKLDWVYQEEIYGRGNYRGYWWSPDSGAIAYLQLDERNVPSFTLVDHIPYRAPLETWPYPKAGDPNPGVRLGVVDVEDAETAWVDLSSYGGADLLIVNVAWSPDSQAVFYQVQDREQRWLDLNRADAAGASRTVFRETTPAWVSENGSPRWLGDGSFLWFSERTGWKHLYHYDAEGALVAQVTSGEWEVRNLYGVDENAGWIYFGGTERSPIAEDVYRIRMTGTDLQRLSREDGTHAATFNPSATMYIDSWSNVTTPPQVAIHRADGTLVRSIHEGSIEAMREFRLSAPEFLTVRTRDGFPMEAMMIKPPDFDPSRKYPVYQHTYAGPHAPQVRNVWAGSTGLYHQLLAQHGIIVWICDNRTASGKGAQSAWPVYQNFGELELRDIEDGVAWLRQQPFVDESRIGINGWSYGGFMVSYALTNSRSFAFGIAGGSVTDWRDYDTIYTERFMRTPENNPEGYRRSSPRFKAADLHGNLLLVHGTIDDNVHMQNTLQFAYELQKAGRPFRLMLYPKSRHAVTDPELVWHLRSLMLAFVLEQTGIATEAPVSTAAR